MDILTAKQIRIEDYLHSLGHTPVRRQGVNLWYRSPLRQEKEASFKVNTGINCWYDFGLGKGGNLLALAAELHPSSDISGLLRQIAERNPPVRSVSVSAGKPPSEEPAFRHLATLPLTSHALLAYLSERGIGAETARRECREIRYECRGKRYYAVGFPNIAGGFELRSRYFKGCVSPKSVSVIPHGEGKRTVCCLFEGFMDYLSFLVLREKPFFCLPGSGQADCIVLNSVSNFAKALTLLDGYGHIYCFLDNDAAGKRALEELGRKFGPRMHDMAPLYEGYKDLNDCLVKHLQDLVITDK